MLATCAACDCVRRADPATLRCVLRDSIVSATRECDFSRLSSPPSAGQKQLQLCRKDLLKHVKVKVKVKVVPWFVKTVWVGADLRFLQGGPKSEATNSCP